MALVYADASALAKLIVAESESIAISELLGRSHVASSQVVSVELVRMVRRHGAALPPVELDSRLARAAEVTAGLLLVPLDEGTLSLAAAIPDAHLRTLAAIHVASALTLAPTSFITYDKDQAKAAGRVGLAVAAPD